VRTTMFFDASVGCSSLENRLGSMHATIRPGLETWDNDRVAKLWHKQCGTLCCSEDVDDRSIKPLAVI